MNVYIYIYVLLFSTIKMELGKVKLYIVNDIFNSKNLIRIAKSIYLLVALG